MQILSGDPGPTAPRPPAGASRSPATPAGDVPPQDDFSFQSGNPLGMDAGDLRAQLASGATAQPGGAVDFLSCLEVLGHSPAAQGVLGDLMEGAAADHDLSRALVDADHALEGEPSMAGLQPDLLRAFADEPRLAGAKLQTMTNCLPDEKAAQVLTSWSRHGDTSSAFVALMAGAPPDKAEAFLEQAARTPGGTDALLHMESHAAGTEEGLADLKKLFRLPGLAPTLRPEGGEGEKHFTELADQAAADPHLAASMVASQDGSDCFTSWGQSPSVARASMGLVGAASEAVPEPIEPADARSWVQWQARACETPEGRDNYKGWQDALQSSPDAAGGWLSSLSRAARTEGGVGEVTDFLRSLPEEDPDCALALGNTLVTALEDPRNARKWDDLMSQDAGMAAALGALVLMSQNQATPVGTDAGDTGVDPVGAIQGGSADLGGDAPGTVGRPSGSVDGDVLSGPEPLGDVSAPTLDGSVSLAGDGEPSEGSPVARPRMSMAPVSGATNAYGGAGSPTVFSNPAGPPPATGGQVMSAPDAGGDVFVGSSGDLFSGPAPGKTSVDTLSDTSSSVTTAPGVSTDVNAGPVLKEGSPAPEPAPPSPGGLTAPRSRMAIGPVSGSTNAYGGPGGSTVPSDPGRPPVGGGGEVSTAPAHGGDVFTGTAPEPFNGTVYSNRPPVVGPDVGNSQTSSTSGTDVAGARPVGLPETPPSPPDGKAEPDPKVPSAPLPAARSRMTISPISGGTTNAYGGGTPSPRPAPPPPPIAGIDVFTGSSGEVLKGGPAGKVVLSDGPGTVSTAGNTEGHDPLPHVPLEPTPAAGESDAPPPPHAQGKATPAPASGPPLKTRLSVGPAPGGTNAYGGSGGGSVFPRPNWPPVSSGGDVVASSGHEGGDVFTGSSGDVFNTAPSGGAVLYGNRPGGSDDSLIQGAGGEPVENVFRGSVGDRPETGVEAGAGGSGAGAVHLEVAGGSPAPRPVDPQKVVGPSAGANAVDLDVAGGAPAPRPVDPQRVVGPSAGANAVDLDVAGGAPARRPVDPQIVVGPSAAANAVDLDVAGGAPARRPGHVDPGEPKAALGSSADPSPVEEDLAGRLPAPLRAGNSPSTPESSVAPGPARPAANLAPSDIRAGSSDSRSAGNGAAAELRADSVDFRPAANDIVVASPDLGPAAIASRSDVTPPSPDLFGVTTALPSDTKPPFPDVRPGALTSSRSDVTPPSPDLGPAAIASRSDITPLSPDVRPEAVTTARSDIKEITPDVRVVGVEKGGPVQPGRDQPDVIESVSVAPADSNGSTAPDAAEPVDIIVAADEPVVSALSDKRVAGPVLPNAPVRPTAPGMVPRGYLPAPRPGQAVPAGPSAIGRLMPRPPAEFGQLDAVDGIDTPPMAIATEPWDPGADSLDHPAFETASVLALESEPPPAPASEPAESTPQEAPLASAIKATPASWTLAQSRLSRQLEMTPAEGVELEPVHEAAHPEFGDQSHSRDKEATSATVMHKTPVVVPPVEDVALPEMEEVRGAVKSEAPAPVSNVVASAAADLEEPSEEDPPVPTVSETRPTSAAAERPGVRGLSSPGRAVSDTVKAAPADLLGPAAPKGVTPHRKTEKVEAVQMFRTERADLDCNRCGHLYQCQVPCCPVCQRDTRTLLVEAMTDYRKDGFVLGKASDKVELSGEAVQYMQEDTVVALRRHPAFIQYRDLLAMSITVQPGYVTVNA